MISSLLLVPCPRAPSRLKTLLPFKLLVWSVKSRDRSHLQDREYEWYFYWISETSKEFRMRNEGMIKMIDYVYLFAISFRCLIGSLSLPHALISLAPYSRMVRCRSNVFFNSIKNNRPEPIWFNMPNSVDSLLKHQWPFTLLLLKKILVRAVLWVILRNNTMQT